MPASKAFGKPNFTMCSTSPGVMMHGRQRNFFTSQEAFSRGSSHTPDPHGSKAMLPCQITRQNDMKSTFSLRFFCGFHCGGIMNAHGLLSID
jgi:hypothetical protein